MRILVLLVLVAACGGGGNRPAAPPAEPAEPPIPQAPAGTDRALIEKETQILEELADRTCACKDLACVQAVDDEVVAYARIGTTNDTITDLETWPADLDARGRRATYRMYVCATKYGYTSRASGAWAIRHALDLRERACACDDVACARRVHAAMAEYFDEYKTERLDEPTMATFTADAEKARQCIEASFPDVAKEALPAELATRARGGAAPIASPVISPAAHLVAIQTLAKKGCACADRTCLAAVDSELGELVRSIELVPRQALHPAQVKESMSALEKLSVCMTDQQIASPGFGRAIADRYAELVDLECACADDECRNELARTLPESFAAFYFPIEDDAFSTYEDIRKRALACYGDPDTTAPARAIGELTALRDTACACVDAACAAQVQADFDVFLEDHKETRGSEADAKTIGALAAEMSGCLKKAMSATP